MEVWSRRKTLDLNCLFSFCCNHNYKCNYIGEGELSQKRWKRKRLFAFFTSDAPLEVLTKAFPNCGIQKATRVPMYAPELKMDGFIALVW